MPTGYQIDKQDACYYMIAHLEWVDIFTRKTYRDIITDSLNYCIDKKGLEVFAWVLMSNHLHLLARAAQENLSDVIRDFKRQTSRHILSAIEQNSESRREWMLDIFSKSASKHVRNQYYQLWTHENHAEEIYSSKFTLQKIL